MIISKELAKSISVKLVEKKQIEIEKIDKQIESIVYDLAKKTVPKNVFDFYEKHKQFFYECNSIQLSGNGLNYETIILNKSIPSKNTWRISIIPNEINAKKLCDLFSLKEKIKKERADLKLEIETALLNLKTYKKIETEFKEAFDLIPNKQITALSVNVDSIRKKL